jgi:hypothetical protein
MIQKKPLEERIHDLERECREFVHKRATETTPKGVPVTVIERMLMVSAGGNPFLAAQQISETKRREEEVARRQVGEPKQSSAA